MTGQTEPICPYCGAQLAKMPGRKKKCPACNQYIYVRTRPEDRLKVLVTEQGTREIDEQWQAVHAMRELRRSVDDHEFEQERTALAERFGVPPADRDVLWSLHVRHLTEHAMKANWGLYTSVCYHQARLLLSEGRQKQALDKYLEVMYLDANGPNNLGGKVHPDLSDVFRPFDPKSASFAPAIVSELRGLLDDMKLDKDDLRGAFLAVAQQIHDNLNTPVPPETAWESICIELYGNSSRLTSRST